MDRNQRKVSAGGVVLVVLVLANAIILEKAMVSNPEWYWMLVATIPALVGAAWSYGDTA